MNLPRYRVRVCATIDGKWSWSIEKERIGRAGYSYFEDLSFFDLSPISGECETNYDAILEGTEQANILKKKDELAAAAEYYYV
jgi:hypothetical protein